MAPGSTRCATPFASTRPVPAKKNRISASRAWACSRTWPPGAMVWTPAENPRTPGLSRGDNLTSAYPFAGTGCQKLRPASAPQTTTAPRSPRSFPSIAFILPRRAHGGASRAPRQPPISTLTRGAACQCREHATEQPRRVPGPAPPWPNPAQPTAARRRESTRRRRAGDPEGMPLFSNRKNFRGTRPAIARALPCRQRLPC